MAQQSMARKHRAAFYDGTNGAAVLAEIPGSSLVSGGTGQTTLVFNITDAGQQTIQPNRNIVWTEYPNTPVQVLDTALTNTDLAQVYGLLGDIPAIVTAMAGMSTGALKVQRGTAVTDGSGVATITWPTSFSGTPVVALGLETSNASAHSGRITANSSSATTVTVLRAPVVTVLSINVLGATVAASGVTVHAIGVAPV